MESSNRAPSFCMAMSGDFSKELQIPAKFVEHFGGVLPENFILCGPARKLWHVNVKKVENVCYFRAGWSLFVHDNSLQFGDFLVFCYVGNSEFNVRIFGKNGCKKDVSVATEKCSEAMSNLEDKFKGKKFQPIQGNIKQLVIGNSAATQARAKARALEEASKFVSKHFAFQVVMTKYYSSSEKLHLPASFVKSCGNVGRQRVLLQVSNRSWSVNMVTYANSVGRLCGGWPAFVKDNSLQEGDVCVFELIQRNEFVMKVHIFRCAC